MRVLPRYSLFHSLNLLVKHQLTRPDVANNPQIAHCQHIFCKDCIEGQAQPKTSVPHYPCPKCDTLVGSWTPYADKEGSSNSSRQAKSSRKNKNDHYKPPVKSEWLELAEKNPKLLLPSSKTIAVKAQMLKWLNEAPDDKIISKYSSAHFRCSVLTWNN